MPKFSTLDGMGLKHGTDKASSSHDYLNFYELFLAPLRDKELTILEIGVLNGASLRMWEEYFPRARVIGADIVPTSKQFEKGRVTIEVVDQSNIEELTWLSFKHGPFDIIVEDGSHMWDHQITSLRTLFPFVKRDGVYIVEDLQTNYGSMQKVYKGVASSTCVEYLKAWLDLRVADDQISLIDVEDAFLRTYGRAVDFIAFYRRACLIKKRISEVVRDISAGQPLVAGATDGQSVAIRVLAHISRTGDVFGPAGFVNLGSDDFALQGLSIDSDEEIVEYRVGWLDGTWSAWCQNTTFVGTRGESKVLAGLAVRLQENVKDRYKLRTFGRFVGSSNLVEVSDGQDCTSVSGGALCGIHIQLTRCADL
jgi:hypothetical protein